MIPSLLMSNPFQAYEGIKNTKRSCSTYLHLAMQRCWLIQKGPERVKGTPHRQETEDSINNGDIGDQTDTCREPNGGGSSISCTEEFVLGFGFDMVGECVVTP